MPRRLKRLPATLSMLGVVSVGHSQEVANTFYIGGGLGSFFYSEDLTPIDPELNDFSDISFPTWKIYGGFNFNEYFGIEGTYWNSGTFSEQAYGVDPSFGPFRMDAKVDFRSVSLKGMGYLPIPSGALFAGIGHFEADSDLVFTALLDCCDNEFYSSSALFSGAIGQIGAQWNISSIVLRAEYEWWDIDGVDAAAFSVGASWRF